MAQKTIAIIICSTRSPRICPTIAAWLTSLLTPRIPSRLNLVTLDLASYPLPLSPSGNTIPAKLSLPLGEAPYEDEQVNIWSNEIRKFDAFIFLTPQYNWSIPGALKVAVDHLFHEWAGKPIMVVTYGGHGGGKCAVHMRELWKGLRGGECVAGVELALGGGMGSAVRGVLDGVVVEKWREGGKEKEVVEGWGKLLEALGEEET